MKNLKPGILCLLLICIYSFAGAQKALIPKEPDLKKPKLFLNLPDRVPLSVSLLTPLLSLKAGQPAHINLSDKFLFKGTIVSVTSKYNNTLRSVVIKSAENNAVNLTFSQITNPDGSFTYRGRIISFHHGDCFELKAEKGQYTLVKRNLNDIVND